MKEKYKNAVEHLSGGVKIPTVSHLDDFGTDFSKFEDFISYLQTSYPLVFEKLKFERINSYGLLFEWSGQDKSLKPLLFTAHYDVVDVDKNTENQWEFKPFSGVLERGFIWGRGALDDKASLFAWLEAVNSLLEQNYVPKRNIFLAFGQDEEVGGAKGAKEMVKILETKHPEFEMVLDEGGEIAQDNNGNLSAGIGICEKGRIIATVKIRQEGGHASRPLKNYSTISLANFIQALHKNQMKQIMTQPLADYLDETIKNYDSCTKFLIKNKKFLTPLLLKRLEGNKFLNAMTRNTMAITMLKASETVNVIPEYVEVIIDIRLLPSQTLEIAKAHLEKIAKKTLKNIKYEIETLTCGLPEKASSKNSEMYKILTKEIKNEFPKAHVVPVMVLGGTDAKNYESLSENVFRFLPLILTDEENSKMHSANENISAEKYLKMINFYENLLKNNF